MIHDMAESIRINFGKPLPLFPLHESVLLPHAVLPLHIFEERYRQMVNDCMDQAGQIAMATFADHSGQCSSCADEYEMPKLRPAVCIGQIVQHEGLPDGRHNILLHGVCRAKIVRLHTPTDERLYWQAELSPLEKDAHEQESMPEVRMMLQSLLQGPRLSRMRSVDTVLEWFDREEIPTCALLELIGFMLVKNNDVKYRLLAEPDPCQRAEMIKCELNCLDRLVQRAECQSYTKWPKGMSWN